jgi:hypothetical protein
VLRQAVPGVHLQASGKRELKQIVSNLD